jgi:hypothetical protein
MPALEPPGMQIGALPPGFGPLPPAGPALAYGFNLALPAIVQQVTAATTTLGPTGITVNIAATQAGTMIVALVAYAEGGAVTVPTPAGYTLVAGTVGTSPGNTVGGRVFIQPANPGGLTTFVLSSTVNTNAIAVAVYEVSNLVAPDGGYSGGAAPGNQTYSNSSTNTTAPSYVPTSGPVILLGFECDVTGQAYTPANVGANWVTGTAATSTTGTTNVVIRPFSVITTPELVTTYRLAGSLAGAIAMGGSLVSVLANTSGPLTQPGPQAFPAAAAAIAAWGALGGTKPGGAGGGQ